MTKLREDINNESVHCLKKSKRTSNYTNGDTKRVYAYKFTMILTYVISCRTMYVDKYPNLYFHYHINKCNCNRTKSFAIFYKRSL